MKFTILEKVRKDDILYRKEREIFHIKTFNTHNRGLNVKPNWGLDHKSVIFAVISFDLIMQHFLCFVINMRCGNKHSCIQFPVAASTCHKHGRMVVLTILDLIMVMHQLDRENIYKYCEWCNFQLDLKQQNFLVPGCLTNWKKKNRGSGVRIVSS